MRVVVLPLCQLESTAHVLLKYEFRTFAPVHRFQDFALSPYCSSILPTGSIQTVCQLIKTSAVLRYLFNIDDNLDDHLLENKKKEISISFENDQLIVVGDEKGFSSEPSIVVIDFKEKSRFISFGPESDVCLCALFVGHVSSLELNYVDQADPPIVSRQTSRTSSTRSHSEQSSPSLVIHRDFAHLWIAIRDLRHRAVHIDHILKQSGIQLKLAQLESWLNSFAEEKHDIQTKTNIDQPLRLLKARARTLIWDLMEMKNEILYPRPVHGRIPNFRNNPDCSINLGELREFQYARVIEIGPSLAQEHLRLFALKNGKVLLTPAPSIENGLFYKIEPRFLHVQDLSRAATKSGLAALGTIVTLAAVGNLHVDIVVVASVVVNPISGARLGKGKGYGDIEYAMMRQLGACDDTTLVMTTVHESQLLNDLPASVMTEHDLPVHIVVTPQRVIYTQNQFPCPKTINWNEIDPEMMMNLPVLKEFKRLQSSSNTST